MSVNGDFKIIQKSFIMFIVNMYMLAKLNTLNKFILVSLFYQIPKIHLSFYTFIPFIIIKKGFLKGLNHPPPWTVKG